MTISMTAVATSPQRETALPLPPSAQAQNHAGAVRDTPAPDGRETAVRATASEKNEALAEINQSLKMASIGVRFEFDKEADIMIAKVVDVESGDVIRQMPSEEVVHISKVLGKLQGLLVSEKV